MADATYNQSLTVAFDYPVVFTRGLFESSNPVFEAAVDRLQENRAHRLAVFIDSGVDSFHPALRKQIRSYCAMHPARLNLVMDPFVVPGGEGIKTDLSFIQDLVHRFAELHLSRQCFVVALGGGAVLDAIGFAAALFHRGVRLVRVPTTVLAQNDVGVGVKNALNLGAAKNLIGTFAPPFAVLNDFDFLSTLSDRDWIAGVAEAFKVAIIRDADFFRVLVRDARRLRAREAEPMEALIRRCAELHLEHIRGGGDPFEFGRARPLDFGHWAAHKLESLSGYAISHGEAVAIGIALDSCYAALQGWISGADLDAIVGGLRESGFSLWSAILEERDAAGQPVILAGLQDFREHLGGELHVTYPQGIGRRFEVNAVDLDVLGRALERLRNAAK